MKKARKIAVITILLILGFLIINQLPSKKINAETLRSNQIFLYLRQENNQKEAYDTAIKLNDGKSSNACVYFVSEVLRRNNIKVRKGTSNTTQLITALNMLGWSKDTDYKNLRPGDICFTTDSKGNKDGSPTHSYVFMGWVREGQYDYAYICDNQATDYQGNIYHIRNVKNPDNVNGFDKEALSFFMKI